MGYNSTYTGVQVDAAVAKHFLLEGQGGAVSANALTTRLNDYLTLSDASTTYLTKTDANTTYLTKTDASNTYIHQFDPVFWRLDYITNPYNQVTLTDQYLPFNAIRQQLGPGALTSDGFFQCQAAGFYFVHYYGFNETVTTNTNCRTRLVRQDSGGNLIYYDMTKGNYGDRSTIFWLSVGDRVGVYFTSTTTIYAGTQHNALLVYRLSGA